MASARDVIKGALRRIGVIAAGEDPAAEDAADALTELNGLMSNARREGIDYVHATLRLTDALTMDDGLAMYWRDVLALRLAEEYGRPVTPGLFEAADTARRMLMAAHKTPTSASIDEAIYRPITSSFYGASDG